jgi:heme-degrading monooxygenase HmoA
MTYLRIWRTALDLSRVEEYERFVEEVSRPMFKAQRGFRGVIFSRSGNEAAVLSFWEDRDAIGALGTSKTYQEAVRAIGATGFLTADSGIEVFEIHSGVIPEASALLHR